jgi:uncharacterized protein (TIGR02217 family)
MGFLTQRFPERITRGAVGGPVYRTTVAYLPSGREQRNIDRQYPQHQYDVSQGIKTDADWRDADEFFRKARGRAHAFRYKDWADYQLAVGDSQLTQITTTTFQLAKVYGADEPTWQAVRNLTRIVTGTLKVYLDSVLKSTPADYTADLNTGIVTFTSAPGAAVRTASCEFDVPCRFDLDDKRGELVFRRNSGQTYLRWENIRIIEDMAG